MFTREDTKAVKGVAVILMLLHHLAYSIDRAPLDFQGFASIIPGFVENGYLAELALDALVCVPLFFFLGGYGLYKRVEAGGFSLWDTVMRLYKQYWRVFVIFIPLGLLLFAHGVEALRPYCVRFLYGSPRQLFIDLLANFTGYTATFNGEWWFFGSYLCTLLLGCLFCRATRRRAGFLADMFLVCVIDILTQVVFPGLAGTAALTGLSGNLYFSRFFQLNKYAAAFFAGIVFARYDMLARLKKRIAALPLPRLAALAGVIGVMACRAYVVIDVDNADILLTPALVVFLSVLLDKLTPLRLLFGFLGRHSANMWLVHTFYCYYFLEFTKLVYCTQCVWIDLAVLTALSLSTSVLLELFYRYLGMLLRRLGRRQAAYTD